MSNIVIHRSAVKSGSLKSVGYSKEHRLLDVEFNGGRVYRYAGVPPEVYDELRKAESIGSFMAAKVKGRFEVSPLPAEKGA